LPVKGALVPVSLIEDVPGVIAPRFVATQPVALEMFQIDAPMMRALVPDAVVKAPQVTV